MAPLVLSIGFLEANSTNAIKYLCRYAGLEPTAENAKKALKQLAVEQIQTQRTQEEYEQAESRPKIE